MKTLRDIRTEAGITQAEAAKRMGISRVYYNAIENGKRKKNMDIDTMHRISRAFDIDLDEVLRMVV